MSYEHYILTSEENELSTILELIQSEKLAGKNRKRQNVYRRYYLIRKIRDIKIFWTLEQIGELFNRDHATMSHALSMHDILTETNDKIYQCAIIEVESYLGNTIINKDDTLRNWIKDCKSLGQFKTIQKLVTSGEL